MATAKKTAAAKTGTAVATRKASTGAVADIKAALTAQAAADAARVAPSTGKQIRITQDKSFVLPDGTKTRDPLQLVVVDFVSRNMYYENGYEKDNIVPPNCFAISPEPRGMVPSDNSPDKQHETCKGCAWDEFGSAPTGRGKACKNTRLLAVLPPDADEDTELWTLSVSSTGLKSFDSFVAGVNRAFSMPPMGVVVTVSFSDASTYPSLEFSDPQPNENLEVAYARRAEAREMLMVEPDVSNFGKEAPAKAAPARKSAPIRKAR